ncbi:hypothetical protein [Rhizobium halophytocola]|uniref:Uncharacterized protein n=1 Tax=Rhizobium halophytocola TaxID=735519 RepID=A0ABS4DXW7_9HYPH|nr:hypothetical protein [Rhizobium halophytocola]MBP1850538.1 hypothetical protein [Rhizobium halophytocola]
MTAQIRIPIFTGRAPRKPVEIRPMTPAMTPLQTLADSQAAINRGLTYALGGVLAFTVPYLVADGWARAAMAQETGDVAWLRAQIPATPWLLTNTGLVTAIVFAACGLAFGAWALAMLMRTRRSKSAAELRAAIAYSLTLSSQHAQTFLRAVTSGNDQALTLCWPKWPDFRNRFVAAELDDAA